MKKLLLFAKGLLLATGRDDPELEKYLVLTNLNGLFFCAFDLLMAAVAHAFDVPYIATVLLLGALSFLVGSIGFNSLGFHNLSRISTVSIGSILVLLCAFYVGRDQLPHASLLLGAIFPFVYFRVRELWQIGICLAVPVAGYALLLIFDFHLGPRAEPLSPLAARTLEVACMLLPYLGIVVNTYAAVAQREEAANELRRSKEQLQALFQALSHDFTTPLAVARLTLTRHQSDRLLNKNDFDRVDRAVANLDLVLTRFRSLANVFVRKKEIELTAVEVAGVFARLHEKLAEPLRAKRIKLIFKDETRGLHARVLAEPVTLEHQVLQNLLHNAIKFSAPGSTIEVRATDVDGERTRLSVSDEGVGIPLEKVPRLFSWDQPTTTLGTSGEVGSGFGLPTVRLCLATMGASIRVLAREAGTTFEMEFKKSKLPT